MGRKVRVVEISERRLQCDVPGRTVVEIPVPKSARMMLDALKDILDCAFVQNFRQSSETGRSYVI